LKYAFRLERVLTLRCRQREQATLRHAEAKQRLMDAQAKLGALMAVLEKTLSALDQVKRSDRLCKETLHYHMLHCAGVKQDMARTESEIREADLVVERTTAELLEAHRATEVLEKLKEKDHEAWKEEQAKLEREQMDEVAVTRHRMKEENHGP